MKTHFISVFSKDRDSGSSSSTSFRWTLPHVIKNFKRLSLVSCELPLTYFNVRSGTGFYYNLFQWSEGSTSYSVYLTSGSYSISALCTALASGMNTASGYTYTISYSTTTFKVTIATSSGSSMTITSTYLATFLGFAGSESGTSVTSTNTYALATPDLYWCIVLRNISTNYQTKATNATYKTPLQSDAGYINYFSANSQFEQFVDLHSRDLSYFDVVLVDDYANQLDLNGTNWSMTLRCEADD